MILQMLRWVKTKLATPNAALLLGALVSGLALRIFYAFYAGGIDYPDAIYQSKEIAHQIVFGTGDIPWEFQYNPYSGIGGSRNILHPLFYVPFYWICDVLRVNWALVVQLSRLLDALVSFSCLIAFCWWLKRRFPMHSWFVAASTLLGAIYLPIIHFGSQSYSNVLYTPLIFSAYALMLDPSAGKPRVWFREPYFWVGILVGLGSVLRMDMVFFVGVFALIYIRIPRTIWVRSAIFAAIGFLVTGILLPGILDWIWYGTPLMSHWRNFIFNLGGGGIRFNRRERLWYFYEFFQNYKMYWWIIWILPSFGVFLLKENEASADITKIDGREQIRLLLVCIIFPLAMSATQNQQSRFLFPWFFFVLMLLPVAALNYISIFERIAKRSLKRVWAIGTVSVLIALFGLNSISTKNILDPHRHHGVTDAITWLGQQDDIVGVMSYNGSYDSGGQSFFHNPKPRHFRPRYNSFARSIVDEQKTFNYVVLPLYRRPSPREFLTTDYTLVFTSRDVEVWKRKERQQKPGLNTAHP